MPGIRTQNLPAGQGTWSSEPQREANHSVATGSWNLITCYLWTPNTTVVKLLLLHLPLSFLYSFVDSVLWYRHAGKLLFSWRSPFSFQQPLSWTCNTSARDNYMSINIHNTQEYEGRNVEIRCHFSNISNNVRGDTVFFCLRVFLWWSRPQP